MGKLLVKVLQRETTDEELCILVSQDVLEHFGASAFGALDLLEVLLSLACFYAICLAYFAPLTP